MTELRDQREIQTIAEALDRLNRKDVESAFDVLVQRIQAIQTAKKKNSSWEKASNIELITSGGASSSMPPGLAGLL